MCLTIIGKQKIAKKNIQLFKILKHPFFTADDHGWAGVSPIYGFEEWFWGVEKSVPTFVIHRRGDVREVENGLHCRRFAKKINRGISRWNVKVEIHKGTRYYNGKYREVVSLKLRVLPLEQQSPQVRALVTRKINLNKIMKNLNIK